MFRPIVEQLEPRDCPTNLITPQLAGYLAAQERCVTLNRDWMAGQNAVLNQQQIWSQEFSRHMLAGDPLAGPSPDTNEALAGIEIEYRPLIEAAHADFVVARGAYFASLESPAEMKPQVGEWDADIAHALAMVDKQF